MTDEEDLLEGLTRKQKVDVFNYAMQTDKTVGWLGAFALASGKTTPFIVAVGALIGALIKWAPSIAGGIHFVE